MNLRAQKRQKNNYVHLFNRQKTATDFFGNEYEVSFCGVVPFDKSRVAQLNIDPDRVKDEEYLIYNGDIIGKICGNCQKVVESEVSDE